MATLTAPRIVYTPTTQGEAVFHDVAERRLTVAARKWNENGRTWEADHGLLDDDRSRSARARMTARLFLRLFPPG